MKIRYLIDFNQDRKRNQGLRVVLYIGPSQWNKLNKSLKTSVSLNAFKHNLNDYYLKKGNKRVKSDRYNEAIITIHSKKSIIIFNLFIYILIYFCLFLIFVTIRSLTYF